MTSNNNKNDKLASLLKSMSGGDDCDRPACDDTKSALSAALQRVGNNKNVDGASSSSTTKKQQHIEENEEKNIKKNRYTACPPTRDEIGASTWSLLHSMVCHFLHTCTLPSLSPFIATKLICYILYTHTPNTHHSYILNNTYSHI